MKKTLRLLGIIAIIALVAFSFVSCEEPENPVVLNWTDGNLATDSSTQTHTFAATSGKTYYIFIKDYWHMSVDASETEWASIMHVGKYDDDSIAYARTGVGNANTTAANFTSTKTGTVTITVDADFLLGSAGNYKIAVTTENKRPSGN